MKNKAILGVGAAALVGAGAWLLFRNKDKITNTAVTSAADTSQNDSFAPSEIPTKITVTGEVNPLGELEYQYTADIMGGNKFTIGWEIIGGRIIKNADTRIVTVVWKPTGRYKIICTVTTSDGTAIKKELVVTESWQPDIVLDLTGLNPGGGGSL